MIFNSPMATEAKDTITINEVDKLAREPHSVVIGTHLQLNLDYMLASYEEWRSKYFLPPLRPWDGQDMFPATATVGPTLPTNLNGVPFPIAWTDTDLGDACRTYYNSSFVLCHIFLI